MNTIPHVQHVLRTPVYEASKIYIIIQGKPDLAVVTDDDDVSVVWIVSEVS